MEIQRQKVIGVGADGIGGVYLERLCWLQVGEYYVLSNTMFRGMISFQSCSCACLFNTTVSKNMTEWNAITFIGLLILSHT